MIVGFVVFAVYAAMFSKIVGFTSPSNLAAFFAIYFLTNLIHSFLTEEIPE